ncbi:Uncharacterized protein SCF082_LOCUS19198 [Durusdinium trenchii]|uniref:Uncharacterized protein n=1 Tax=Durusdinium trenchii TaxID=1381693 RepID=A0ABP0KUK8_9DINO
MKYRVAALDLAYDASYRKRSTKRGKKPAKGQLFDLLSPSGFAMAIMSCLACVQDNHVIVIAVVCSSFVSISRGSTGRSYLNPLGFPDCDATKIGNLLASRLALLLYLIASRGGVWVVEQPSSSLLFRHPRLREACRRMKVFRQSWWMRLYGGFTCKRTKAWSNSRWVFNLGMGKMSRAIRDSVTDRLAVSTTCAKTGRRGYHGSKKLKNSQNLQPMKRWWTT